MVHSRFASAAWIAFAFTLFFAATLPAQVISINFNGAGTGSPAQRPGPYDLLPTEVAGALPVANWNNVLSQNGTTSNLMTSTGAATTTSVQLGGVANAWSMPDSNGSNVIPFDAQGTMMRGYLDTGNTTTTTVTVSGLSGAFTSIGYRVWVYFDGDNDVNNRVNQFNLAGQTRFGRDAASTSFNGTFVEVPFSSTTNQSATTPAGNYTIFTGLFASSFTLTSTPAFGTRAPINAIQIEVAPVPEPGSLTLLGAVAAAGLWARRRSRQ